MITVLLIDHDDEDGPTPEKMSHRILEWEGVETVMNITSLIYHPAAANDPDTVAADIDRMALQARCEHGVSLSRPCVRCES
jgi:hypothetical protein